MQILIQRLVVLFFIGNPFSSSLLAYQDNLEEFIERDSAAFVVIQDPEAILAQIESSVLFDNHHFQRAMELLIDDEFPLATPERLDELQNKWFELRDLISRIEEISLIVHSWDEGFQSVPKFSIAFTAKPEPIEEMESLITDIKSSMSDSDSELPDFFSIVAGHHFAGISIQQAGNIVLLSNAPEKSKELVSRLNQTADKKFKSLARNRSYMQVQKLLAKRADSPQIRGFLAPQKFRHLITKMVAGDQVLIVEPPESIASAGFQVLLQNDADSIDTPDGTYQPAINWDFVLTYTQPASGFGKLIDSYEPFVEFPSLPFAITSLNAIGFDLTAKHAANKEIFDRYQKHLFAGPKDGDESGGMTFEQYFKFTEFGLFGMKEEPESNPMLNATNGVISVYHEDNSIHWKPAMEIRRVKNREAMELLVAQKLKTENATLSKDVQLVEIPNDYGRLFARPESSIREFLKKQAKSWRNSGEEPPKDLVPVESEPLSDSVMSRQFEYFVNDDWMIHCDHNSMKKFLKGAYEEPPEPGAFDLLMNSTRDASGQSEFFKFTYQSNKFYKVQNKRMQNSIESLRIKEKYGTGRLDQSREVWGRLMAEPDEYGLRNEIESAEDAAVAVQQLIVHAFNDTFGTVVSLYTRDDHKMRIFGQVYSLVDE